MKEEKIIIIGLLLVFICVLVLFFTACHQYKANKIDSEKDRLILIEANSIGCGKYKYNGSVIWKCPKELELHSIESTYCSGGKPNSCETKQEPVL